MKRLLQVVTAGVLLLFVGLSISNAQVYSAGPSTTPISGAANGGFAWADMNGDGILDLFIPSNNLLINGVGSFTQNATATASVALNTNSVGLALADFNGDGVPDLMTTNGGSAGAGLYYNTGGVFTAATGTGDLASVPTNGQLFQGLGVAPIDHSNYLSIVIPHTVPITYSDGLVMPPNLGMVLLKGGASGFTHVGKYATAGNAAIDTSKSFEMWDPRFFDANNDGWMDLMVPSFRHGFRSTYGGPDSAGARKGCIMFLNDGTGKFVIPTATSLGRTIYNVDSMVAGVSYGRAVGDTGIIVDDTVRHFNAIGNQVGDLNNDGNIDMMFTGTEGNWNGLGSSTNTVIVYGKGDGTFTYRWNGVTTVAHGVNSAGNQRAMSIGDYNNDGWPDIYISQTFGAQLLFKNNGNGTFANVTTEAVVTGGGQRAGGFVDYNNDGFLDIYQYTGGNSVLQKNNGNVNKWIGFKPIGTGNNMMAIGARFTVWSGATKQIRDIRASGGAAGDAQVNALFGLGTGNADSVMVQWPDGTTNKWTRTQLSANGGTTVESKYWTIQYGAIIPAQLTSVDPQWKPGVNVDTTEEATVTLKWNKTSGGTGSYSYQYQVATASSFATSFRTATGLTDSIASIRVGLSTKYYWRVRALSAGFTGPWSAVDSFRTKVVPCTVAPTKLWPANGSLTEPAKPTLKVSYVPEASPNHIQVDSVNRFTTQLVVNDSVNIYDTTYTFANNLVPGKKYYWRVRGWNNAGSSAFSPVDSFTIMYLPVAPATSYPANNQPDVIANNVTFKWRKVAGDSTYILQTWTYTSSGMLLRSDTTKHDTSFTVASLAYRSRYFWKVMAFNQGGSGPFSPLDSFTTAIEPPGAPVTDYPKAIENVNRIANFRWRTVPTGVKYHLQVASPNNFTVPANIVVDEFTMDTTLQIADTLAASKTYYWRISATNAGGEGVFSASTFFTTGTALDVEEANSTIPKEYALMQNYPNPFNPTTTIGYDLPKDAFVKITVFDILGRVVATLVNTEQSASRHRIQWNASGLSSGMYIYRIQARSLDGSGDFTAVKKLLLMK